MGVLDKLRDEDSSLATQIKGARAEAAEAGERMKTLAADPNAYNAEERKEADALARVASLERRRAALSPLIADAEAREQEARVDQVEERAKGRTKLIGRTAEKAHKALLSAAPALAELRRLRTEHEVDNAFLRQHGREPVASGEIAARTVPGRSIEARYEERPVWVKPNGAPVVVFRVDPRTGERVPTEAGARKTTERVCVQPARDIPPRVPKSLADEVVIPGWMADDEPVWSPKGGR